MDSRENSLSRDRSEDMERNVEPSQEKTVIENNNAGSCDSVDTGD